MIIVKLMGGLGNQMFQYALGRHLAIKKNSSLALDLTFLNMKQEGVTPRHFELDCFRLGDYKLASALDLFFVDEGRFKDILKRFLPIKKWIKVVREKGPEFDPFVLTLSNNVCLEGYWNSEKYFFEIEKNIREELSFKSLLSDKNRTNEELILSAESVSVHIRRGDYVNDLKTNKHHGVCKLDYYEKAVENIEKMLATPQFFVFSDDIEWAKVNLKIKHPVVYIDNNNRSFEDMHLMSRCRHNIIANSTFSWWGAWLNPNPNKIVIAPDKWLNADLDTKDIVPKGWLKV